MIVIFTGDKNKALNRLETSSLTLKTEQVFLSHLDGDPIYQSIKKKLKNKEGLMENSITKTSIEILNSTSTFVLRHYIRIYYF